MIPSDCVRATGGTAAVITALNRPPCRSSADTLLLAALTLYAVVLARIYVLRRPAVGRALCPVRRMTDQATIFAASGWRWTPS